MQEHIVYGTYTQYIAIRLPAESHDDAINRAKWLYDYDNACDVEEDERVEVMDSFINFSKVVDE